VSDNPYESPHVQGEPEPAAKNDKTGRRRSWLIEALAVFAVLGILVALLLPARREAREAARRMSCSNNLKQLVLGLHNYHDRYGAFPPACTVDADGKPLHSWRTLILPFIEQQVLYDKIDLSQPWDHPANREAFDTSVVSYQCPSVELDENYTTYLAVVAPGSCLRPGESCALVDVTDDHSKSLVLLEVSSQRSVHWMSPNDAGAPWELDFGKPEHQPHPSGCNAAFVDGGVRFLSANMDEPTLRAMVTIDGDDGDDILSD
jgi:prepilin-type processing-associated H-X9-DG protein